MPVLLLCVGLVVGCNDNDLGIERRTANRPPETILSSGPPDSSSAVYKVHLFWSGSDPDGTVDHYDYILVDHPAIQDNIDGSGPNPVIVEVPGVDDPRWQGSTATDSIFVTLADTLRHDNQPSDTTGTAEEIRELPWERWHTFFIRAVDNEGLPDPTPDYRSFNSMNIAPSVWLTAPIQPNVTFIGPSLINFNWDGEDAVGDGDVIAPVASRWVIIDSQIDSNKQPLSYPDSLYVLPERYQWSPWARWEAADGSGRRAIVRNLLPARTLEDGSVVGYYVFAVQAMDEAGAITPVFDRATPRRNNAVSVRVSGAVGPLLTVREPFLSVTRWLGDYPAVVLEIAAGQPLRFCWEGDANRYGGEIQDYRYGWDIRNPENDDEWDQSWCASCLCATPRAFGSGTHTLFIQVRDNAESITEAKFVLNVNQVTRSRDLLWVDDTQSIRPRGDSNQEDREDATWLGILSELAQEHGFEFDPILDVYDVEDNRFEVPPISTVFNYKAVLWGARQSRSVTAAQQLMRFVDPFLEINQNDPGEFNYMLVYLQNGGNLWLHGTRIALQLWPDLTNAQRGRPVNVTNWDDDPREQHPLIDSVGTLSTLYDMGVEMFDCGGGTGCGTREARRSSRDHLCQGLARAVPQGSEVHGFETSTNLSHRHHVDIETADVDAAGMGEDVTYETRESEGHTHRITLTPMDFEMLRRGETITLHTTDADMPEVHSHEVTLVDPLGLWGIPALSVGPTWAPDPPNTGRPNVEIYNMPGEMAVQLPPLVPLEGISTPLYTYISKVKEDPEKRIFYPLTADKQPVALLAKGHPSEPFYSRAICGFEPEWLSRASLKELTRFILVRHFRTGLGDGR